MSPVSRRYCSRMKLLTIGTFDTPHIGHDDLILQCRRYTDDIHIGINSDEFVEKFKGHRPTFSYAERSTIIERVFEFPVYKNYDCRRTLIEWLKPDIIAIGTDWIDRPYLEQIAIDRAYLDENDIALVYLPRKNISSSDIRRRSG